MEKQHKLELIVGITVLIAVLLVIWVIFWTKGAFMARDVQIIPIKFDQVGGLTKNDLVTVSGVNVGRVRSIQIQQDSVLVNVRITKEISIKQDARAIIVSAELMGGKKIELHPGFAGQELAEGEVIRGKYTPGITELAGLFEENRGDLEQLMRDIQITVESLKELLGGNGGQNSLRAALDNMASSTNQIDSLLQMNSKAIKATVMNLEQSSEILRKFLASEEGNARELLTMSNELARKLQVLSDTTQVLLNKMGSSESIFKKLMTEDSLYTNLNRTVVSMDSLITDFQNNPEKYFENVEFKVRLF